MYSAAHTNHLLKSPRSSLSLLGRYLGRLIGSVNAFPALQVGGGIRPSQVTDPPSMVSECICTHVYPIAHLEL